MQPATSGAPERGGGRGAGVWRRSWLRRCLWAAGFACLWLNVLDDPPLVSGALVRDVETDAVTIGLIAAHPVVATATLFDGRGGVVGKREAPRPVRRHEFSFDGLSPGTNYDFTIDCGDGCVERGSVRTKPVRDDAEVRLAFLGDSGAQPWWVWLQRTPVLHWPARWGWLSDAEEVTRVGAGVATFRPDFVLHVGDVVYPRGEHRHYAAGLFRPFAEALRRAPMYAVLGNHDVMASTGLQAQANLGLASAWRGGDGRNFSLAWGALRLIGLDTNTELTRDRFAPGHPSHTFLVTELAQATEPWIVVVSHYPIRSASNHRDRGEFLLGLLPELKRYGVSLYLCGHDHCYQRFDARDGEPTLVVSGGGGMDLYPVRPHARATVVASVHHWCSATVRGALLAVRAHAGDGTEVDAFELRLPGAEQLEAIRAVQRGRARRIDGLAR